MRPKDPVGEIKFWAWIVGTIATGIKYGFLNAVITACVLIIIGLKE